ncbi:DinB family protein [Prauserella endophytica]|uniref:DinB family protein n=1 Tax=Prauserella endophytica TaxID=1592324 RepID=A0ABY2RZ82_9PSEU|nr:DinB family protein [Prauserella endophytica]TKG64538.1 DinB family protein [Prauserella endophytica]
MPGLVGPVADEREALLGYLAQQRYVLCLAAYGLTDEQARATPTVSALSVGGLIKHVAATERGWLRTVLGHVPDGGADFGMAPGETLADVITEYELVATETEEIVAGIDDLGRPVPVPKDVPWFPDDVGAWSVRWVLLRVIEETARHAGHADILRESIDGATAFPLMAAAEGWPETPFLKPWRYRSNNVGSST